ncbi:hypothetical protein N7509_001573 [Penicillium cosmopolitanum]|uniref:Uncharacterized protein n=1 Tax=Penicillium cosmopolitanum TaxID=1131564 RepID=A0A9W9W798_9EURO|nr:uncharacterized protein N7509_001573 [Penicillium cosmopolitanum]KAJ5407690.1 hypothetical protein N7509_001573 [Penicillium cosmopolitanum]
MPIAKPLIYLVSQNIAPEMVIVDDHNNGWRHMILPIAHRDELVMNAVLAASAFHLSSRRGCGPQDAAKLYTMAIRELQKKRSIDKYDLETQHVIILTILVLLVALMVNGSSDFPIVFHVLQFALQAIGGDSKLAEGDLAQFLLRQIHKIRVYGAPFISQDVGTSTLIFEGQQSFDCLEYYRHLYPTYFDSFDRIASLRQQAYDIYLYRASLGDDGAPSTHLVEDFKSTLEQIPKGSLGEHSLIWACFIAASESHSLEHQLFFDTFLKRQFSRSGFVNILRALDLLQEIRKKRKRENWTKLLPEPQVFIM